MTETSGELTLRSLPADRLGALLDALVERAAHAENAEPIPLSPHHDEIDAIAYAFNVLLAELRFASEAKSAYLRTISHEIRTPATVLVGSATILAREELPAAERAAHADRARRAGNALLALVDNVLDLSRIEANTIDLRDGVVHLTEVFADLRATFGSVAESKGLQLEIDAGFDVPPFAGDPTRVRQILVNLVGNAVKYTFRGRVEVRAAILADNGDRLMVTVADTGPGIADADRDRLFKLYGRGSAAGAEGTGIGLHLARRLAEAMHGQLTLAWSVPDQGSRFELTLPFLPIEQPATPDPPPSRGTPRLSGLRVLVVDDSADIREVLRTMLSVEGAATTVSASADEAVNLTAEQGFDVVLMDIRMPRRSGLEVIRDLRRRGYRRPVVALTADPTRSQEEECLAAGFDGYLAKPVGYEALVNYIGRFGA